MRLRQRSGHRDGPGIPFRLLRRLRTEMRAGMVLARQAPKNSSQALEEIAASCCRPPLLGNEFSREPEGVAVWRSGLS